MIVGVPKEIKNQEYRVSLTPQAVSSLVIDGNTVFIEKGAGIGAGFKDEDYTAVGASVVAHAKVFEESELIVKVKEPLESEYKLFKPGQLIFTYFHFASSKELLLGMQKSGAVCFAYETLVDSNNNLPLLAPMSQIAGKLAVQKGCQYLLKQEGGKGLLPSGLPGVDAANALVIGAGEVGTAALELAYGLGMNVTVLDLSVKKLAELKSRLPGIRTLFSTDYTVKKELKKADVVIGAVLVPGDKAPKIVKAEYLNLMQPLSVLVDVAIDQGGCFESSRPTTHDNPVYQVEGIIHYAVTNMPGAVPLTASEALSNATLPYVRLMAKSKSWKTLIKENESFQSALNVAEGEIVLEALKGMV